MKTTNNTPEKPAADAATTAAPATPPAFDRARAKRVPKPYRHERTARTVAYEQAGDGDAAHLFSATFAFIATETPGETVARVKAEADKAGEGARAPAAGETPAK